MIVNRNPLPYPFPSTILPPPPYPFLSPLLLSPITLILSPLPLVLSPLPLVLSPFPYFKESTIQSYVAKYSFDNAHLGDQDFYTLTSFEHPEFYHSLPCSWNRQLCRWWEDKGYQDVFADYFDCNKRINLYHGNCDTPIPA